MMNHAIAVSGNVQNSICLHRQMPLKGVGFQWHELIKMTGVWFNICEGNEQEKTIFGDGSNFEIQ